MRNQSDIPVVSALFFRRKNVAAESKLNCQEQNWLAESDLACVRKSSAQLRLGAMAKDLVSKTHILY